jgi:hypothetical protein
MFADCTSLISLPQNFQIPQNISGSVLYAFCTRMFYNCNHLTHGTSLNQIILRFKGYTNGGELYLEMFGGTCTIDPNTPNPGAGSTIEVLVAMNS